MGKYEEYQKYLDENCCSSCSKIVIPTEEEVLEEWEERGWKVDKDEYFKTITFIKGDRGIEFDIEEKYYFTFQPTPEHNSFDIDIELHALIHKTLKALEDL